MQCYTLTYYDEGDNKTYATDFINMIVDLCENKLGSNEKLNFTEWKPTISSVNWIRRVLNIKTIDWEKMSAKTVTHYWLIK